MKKFIPLLLALLLYHLGMAQTVNILDGSKSEQAIKHIAVLPDKGYSIEQVSINHTLPFVQKDSLTNALSYWLKVVLFNPTDRNQAFDLNVYPNWEDTFYHYNNLSKRWVTEPSGIASNTAPWLFGVHAYELPGRQIDTVYFKVNVNTPNLMHNAFRARVIANPKTDVDKLRQNVRTAWVVGMLVLLLFSFNNLYIFFSFRDKTVLYYVVTQIGGMMYLTSYWYFFGVASHHIFSYLLYSSFDFYNTDRLLLHVSVVLIFYGFVNLCRSYLNTKITLPVLDKILKYCLYIYIAQSFIVALVNICGFYFDYYIVRYDNMYCVLLILMLLYTSIVAYNKKLPVSGSFLLANISPFVFTMGVSLYHIFITPEGSHNYWLPLLAIITQAFGFSIALVTRTKVIRDTLTAKELESHQLAFDLKEVAYQNQLKENEIQQYDADIKLQTYQNEILQLKLETSQRELVSNSVHLHQKNKLLIDLGAQMQDIGKLFPGVKNPELKNIQSSLKDGHHLDQEWDKFKLHFEQVHPSFFTDLQATHPTLTKYDLRLYAYFHINLSTKEIAALLNIAPSSVRQAKARLNKKMNG